jgi:hypothetical protein
MDNPFEILGLDPTATDEQIVRRAALLHQLATDDDTHTRLRQAVQALTGSPGQRQLWALLTHPRPIHDWPALDQFIAAFRHLPEFPTRGLDKWLCTFTLF